MKHKLSILALLLSMSGAAYADLIYDAGTKPSHGPSGEEVTLQDPGESEEMKAKQVGKNKVDIEQPETFDANDVNSTVESKD